MTKVTTIGLISILLSGCYDEPFAYPPTYPPGYVYNQPPEPYRPDWRYQPGHAVPGNREPAPDAYAPPPSAELTDPDGAARSSDDEEVIGADEPPVDRSGMRVTRQPQVERHRDHRGD